MIRFLQLTTLPVQGPSIHQINGNYNKNILNYY